MEEAADQPRPFGLSGMVMTAPLHTLPSMTLETLLYLTVFWYSGIRVSEKCLIATSSGLLYILMPDTGVVEETLQCIHNSSKHSFFSPSYPRELDCFSDLSSLPTALHTSSSNTPEPSAGPEKY